MSIQHAVQYVVQLYDLAPDFAARPWGEPPVGMTAQSTPSSSYARAYMEHRCGRRGRPRAHGLRDCEMAHIRERIDRELAR